MAFKDKDQYKAYMREYREKNRDRIRAINAAYRDKNKPKLNQKDRERRAAKRAELGPSPRDYRTLQWRSRAQLFIDDWTSHFKRKGFDDAMIDARLEKEDKLVHKLKNYWKTREGSPI